MQRAGQYDDRAAGHAARRDERARVSARISVLRLATFLPAAACTVWLLSRGFSIVLSVAALLLFVAFGALVVWHARVEERQNWFEALRVVNARGAARLRREWPALPETGPPSGIDLAPHPFAQDLDLFGRASLFQWLGPAATPGGTALLARWLLTPAGPQEILERQRAVADLARADEWREQLAARGVLLSGAGRAEVEALLVWAEGGDPLGRHAAAIQWAAVSLTGAIWVLIALNATGVVAAALWLIPILGGIVLWAILIKPMTVAFNRAGGGQQALRRYAGLFEHAEKAPFQSPRVADIRRRLSADGRPASSCMRRLNNILGFAELRHSAGLFHFLIQAVTLWDFHVLFALERWRRSAGGHVRGWLQALGELDALATLAGVHRDNPSWCMPEIVSVPELTAGSLGHPLIADDRRVANDIVVGPPGTILLVTGSNMSGKSTLLRAIGLNTVLAQAGGVVCASTFRIPSIDLQTSIRVQDSLELGLSYFMAALARLKGVVDAAEHERPGRVLLYLLDEILQGTNSVERSIAVRGVARHLLEAGAIGAMTTHDLTLAREEPLSSAARLVHFTETVDRDGTMRFDYKLRPGLATSRNAIRLMRAIGIEP
jgi:hypothetical protein